MQITKLRCQNFKSFDDVTFEFNEAARIVGDNYQGKTSIAEAVTFALFGTSLSGSPQIDHLIKKGQKKATVELQLIGADGTHTIVRSKGSKSELFLDDEKATQSDIDALIGEKERFLAVFVPGYFTSQPDKTGREMLMRLIKRPEQEEVVAKLSKPEQELLATEVLRDPEARAKEIRAEIKDLEAEINRNDGQLSVHTERAEAEVPEVMPFDETELRKLRTQLDDRAGTEIKSLRAELSSLGREYKTLKAQIQTPPDAPYREGDACPTCQQTLDGDALTHVLAHHERQVQTIQTRNADYTIKAQTLIDKGNQMREQLDTMEDAYIEANTSAVKARIAELEQQKAEVERHNGQVNRIRMERLEAIDKKEQLEKQIAQYQEDAESLKETVKAIGAYRAKLAEMQVTQLKKYLNRVDIELFKVTKTTGEVKDCFTVTYDGKDFKSLSLSEGIRANLEIASMMNQVLGMDFPMFVDNAESITHFDTPAATQLFLASVVKGAELTVTSENAKGDAA